MIRQNKSSNPGQMDIIHDLKPEVNYQHNNRALIQSTKTVFDVSYLSYQLEFQETLFSLDTDPAMKIEC